MEKIVKDFENEFKDECLGNRARFLKVLTSDSSQDEVRTQQRFRRVHVEYCKELMLVQMPSVENLCNERELDYSDGRDKRTAGPRFSSIQRTLRSMMVEVPDPKNANETISLPAFETVLPNITGPLQGTATAAIVASRKEAVELYKKMSVCFYAWLYWYCLLYTSPSPRD